MLLFRTRLFKKENLPMSGGKSSILLFDKSIVLKLLASFCRSSGNYGEEKKIQHLNSCYNFKCSSYTA